MKVRVHFVFNGSARAALEFYKQVFNAEVKEIISYDDAKEMCDFSQVPADQMDRIACSKIALSNQYEIHICDQMSGEQLTMGNNVMVDIFEKEAARVEELYKNLSEGGNVIIPLAPVPWSPNYAMLTDRFGITWEILQED